MRVLLRLADETRASFPPLVNSPPLSEGRKGGVVLLGSGGVATRALDSVKPAP